MISVCMIVKDEKSVIKRCVDSVYKCLDDVVSEIVVVDTGSTDGTDKICKELGCDVYDFDWCDDFSKARNFGIEKSSNEWIMVIDADEYIEYANIEELKKFIKENNTSVLGEITIRNFIGDTAESYNLGKAVRIFNKRKVRYRHAIHEIPYRVDNGIEEYKELDIELFHTGYISEVMENKQKHERNLKLIKATLDKEDDVYLHMHLGKTYVELEMYDEAKKELEQIINNKNLENYEFYKESVKVYARCLLNNGEFEEALKCEKYWDTCQDYDSYIYFMGHIYLKNGYFEKSMDCFINIANKENPMINKLDAIYSLGQLFEVIGMNEESIQYYEMCGDYGGARNRIEVLKRK